MTSAWRRTKPATSSIIRPPRASSSCSARACGRKHACSSAPATAGNPRSAASWRQRSTTKRSVQETRTLWGGRFSKPLDERALRYTTSLPVDRRLFEWDVLGSIAHARMLGRQGIIPTADATTLVAGLSALLREPPSLEGAYEDIHSLVEAELAQRVGEAAGRLHTARSRNDQVATDARLFARAALIEGVAGAVELQSTLIDVASQHTETIVPGYTHLQRAQPVTLGHHLLAYWEML